MLRNMAEGDKRLQKLLEVMADVRLPLYASRPEHVSPVHVGVEVIEGLLSENISLGPVHYVLPREELIFKVNQRFLPSLEPFNFLLKLPVFPPQIIDFLLQMAL